MLFRSVHNGHYTREGALSKLSELAPTESSLPLLRDRICSDIAQQELDRLMKENPKVGFLVEDRLGGAWNEYKDPDCKGPIVGSDFSLFDQFKADALHDIKMIDDGIPPMTRIVVENDTVTLKSVDGIKNTLGTKVEYTVTASFPLKWVQQFEPQILKASG